MTKKTTKSIKTSRPKSSKHSVLQILAVAALALLILSSMASWFFISYLWSVQQSESGTKVSTLILNAVEDLSNPAPIEAQTGKAYFHQVRLVLPAAPDSLGTEIEYRYSPAQNEFPEELRIVNTHGFWSARYAMIGAQNIDDTFKHVPKLQACVRGYQITFAPISNSTDELRFTKQLSDSRSVYAYLDSGCKDSNEDFESYLKQIDSY